MSGHSHWATIKHKKGQQDARKGKIFSKCSKLIMVAAKEGGSDPDKNIKLQEAIEKARSVNMPKDNIDRSIKKGAGEIEGVKFENVTFEGYGPGGVAMLVDVLTDNRNRTTAEIRKLFERNNGNMASANSVSWNFEKKGIIRINNQGVTEDDVLAVGLDAGADNVEQTDTEFEVTCALENFHKLKTELEKKFKVNSSEITLVPKSYMPVDVGNGRKLMTLTEALEDHEDVQGVYANFDLPNELIQEKEAS